MGQESKHSLVDTLDQIVHDLQRRSLVHHTVEDEALAGNLVTVEGRPMVNFGSCSYLGLERHPALVEGSMQALQSFGTQFSTSRAYLALNLYNELESLLGQIFDRPVVVTPTTTLGHLSALPVLVRDNDAVILDLQVHSSVQMAAQLLKARGIPLHIIRHNDMEQLENRIQKLQQKHNRVWYLADGIYSMFGDVAPLPQLTEMLDRYKSFHLYVDDAHGMGWTGHQGCGYVRSQYPHHPKMVLAVSMCKSFASVGGVLVFPHQSWADKVKNCGSSIIFSGPIQPPMLGAAIACAKLHLSPEIQQYQKGLTQLIRHTNQRMRELSLPQYCETESPVFFIPMGLPRLVAKLASKVHEDGFYVNIATFPATPMRQGGLRFLINRNLSTTDIDRMLESVCYHYPRVLAEEGLSIDDVARAFGLPHLTAPALPTSDEQDHQQDELQVELYESIDAINAATWDALFSGQGNYTHAGLQLLERVFANNSDPVQRWDFRYVLVRDRSGRIVLATYYTVAMVKDDMLSSAEVSRKVEVRRKEDPNFLVSKTVMLGCLISKGQHLYMDQEHTGWRDALALLLNEMQKTLEEFNATQIMLREFSMEQNDELRQLMLDLGYTEQRLPDECQVQDLDWNDHDEYLARLGQKYRYNVRKEILAHLDNFELVTTPPRSSEEIQECYELYCQVHARAYEINVHRLPLAYFEALCRDPNYEVLRLYLREDLAPEGPRKPVATMFSFVEGGVYTALLVGLDDEYLYTHNTYKQILYQTVQRARQLECRQLELGYTAVLEKKKVGARPHPVCAYVQLQEHYNHAVLASWSNQS